MGKTFPIRLEVEELALGIVLRKLNDMPGIASLNLDLGHGGQGSGRKQLEQHATEKLNGSTDRRQMVIKLLMSGPKSIREISSLVGGNKSRAYGIMTQLRKQGLSEAGEGSAMHQLTKKAMAQLGAVPALPAPSKIKRTPSGRAAAGSGQIILREALDAGPVSGNDLRAHLKTKGLTPKAVDGLLRRTRVSGLVRKNGSKLFELTAKGQKIALTGEASHG